MFRPGSAGPRSILGSFGIPMLVLLALAAACRFEDGWLAGGAGVETDRTDARRPPPPPSPQGNPADVGSVMVQDAAIVDSGDPPAPDAAAPDQAVATDSMPIAPDSGDAPLAASDLRQGLLLWLPLDEMAGSASARDESGHQNRVQLQGLDAGFAWVSGRFDGALELAPGGAGMGHLRVESSASLNLIGAQLTIAIWLFRPAGRAGVVFSRQATSGGSLYRLEITEGNQLRLVVNDRPGVRLNLQGSARLAADAWSHVAITCDEQHARVFIDGRPVARAVHGVPIATDITPLLIGAREGDANQPVSGFLPARVDDLLIYDRALSEIDIAALAAGVRPPGAQTQPPSAR
jgi:hypothetical protein